MHTIAREISIDMGHRVHLHGGKCQHPHGHRYRIIAACAGNLIAEGEQSGMVIDFGFLKEEMMNTIDAVYDHAFTYFEGDELMATALAPAQALDMRINTVPFIPTAENLAKHWYELLAPRITARTNGLAHLASLTAYETPNCSATYTPAS
jgi:6-pyruvoyltetrahydropterin/6-carboxytetrahydropterin synthase